MQTHKNKKNQFKQRKSFVDTYIITNRNMAVLFVSWVAAFTVAYMSEAMVVHAEPVPQKEEVVAVVEEPAEQKPDPYCNPSTNPEVNRLINKYFTTCKDARTIWAIAQAESGGKQVAINKANRNGSWDCGYVQANTIHRMKGETFQDFCNRQMNLEENIKTAAHVYKVQGWTAWVTYNSNCYKAYMSMPVLNYSTCNK